MSEDLAQWPCAGLWLEALEWHATLHEGSDMEWTDARLSEWRRWYSQPKNRRIFEQISQLLEDRDAYCQRHGRPKDADADPGDPGAGRARSPPFGWIKAAAGVLLAGAALACAVLALRVRWAGTRAAGPRAMVYETAVGQLETIHLSDGSTVTLGARTRLTAELTAHRRALRLLHGEAWFRDTDIASQPFSVKAGHGTITALGTSFVVDRDSDRVVVTVIGGTVEVSAMPDAAPRRTVHPGTRTRHPPAVRMVRGEALSYSDLGNIGPVTHVSAQAATAWAHGQLIFNGVPLRYVVENIGRYWSRRITIGPRAGRLRFSGLIYENGIQDWLNGLSTIFPVAVAEAGSSIGIHSRAPNAPRPNQAPRPGLLR